ncbi:hypothetical protein GBAR_LOCUS6981 [Geodia barretti]|uniref:Uncharacterized protein n=1 Tax=Geodia barretti TaxID=519541 RepID=A0AA35RH53_GEOBA|nr:hypothetical protein GBAR_LOCUS6981 [Geodia barretti]
MFIKVEPAEFFMYRVILVFDLEAPNSEDQHVRDYMTECELEPKYQHIGDFEGSNCELMQFGGCYLGRHLGKISEIQRNQVEREIITAEIGLALDDEGDPVVVPDDVREETLAQLVQAFHQPEVFQPNEEGLLEAVLDAPSVRQAARELLAAAG